MTTPAPPGWYHDGKAQRWWDGASWGPYAPPPPPGSMPPTGVPTRNTTMAVLSHVGFFVLSVILPIIVRETDGKTNEFTRHHSTEALNFQLTFLISWLTGLLLFFLVAFSFGWGAILVLFLAMLAMFAMSAYWSIKASIRASRGEWWCYPVSIRFVRGAHPTSR